MIYGGRAELAGLRAVAFVHKDVDVAHRAESGRNLGAEVAHVAVDVSVTRRAELLDQRADQRCFGVGQRLGEIGTACGPMDVLPHPLEHTLDLIVEFGAVGDHKHAAVPDLLPDSSRQSHLREALAAALGVPDYPALAALHMRLALLHAEVLVVTADLPDTHVEHHEIVDQFKQALGDVEVDKFAKQGRVVVVAAVRLLPAEPVLLGSADHTIAKTLAVVARQH